MDEDSFLRCSRAGRLDLLREKGEHVGARTHGAHVVHLYRMPGFFAELWMRAGLDQVEWVEVARSPDVLLAYVPPDALDDLVA